MGWLAWLAAGTIAERRIAQQFNNVHEKVSTALIEPRRQLDDVFASLESFERSIPDCSSELYSMLAEKVEENRYIYQAAVKLQNRKVCSSYGRKLLSPLQGDERGYPAADGHTNWFHPDFNKSADTDFIIVSDSSIYVWLNKAILLKSLGIPPGVQLDLIDANDKESVVSSHRRSLTLEQPPGIGQLTVSADRVFMAYANSRNALVPVISLPASHLSSLKMNVFIALILVGAALLGAALYIARRTHQHYSSTAVKLRRALRDGELQVNYQPIVDMRTGCLVGAEALSRWKLDDVSISPEVFIGAAEKSDLICELTRYVIQRIAEDYSTYLWACKNFYITINVSARDILDETFPDFVAEVLALHDIPASNIAFEVTESTLFEQTIAAAQLQRLRACGHRIAIDDFGTGYSNLSLIHSLPIDILKIDRSFIEGEKVAAVDALWQHIVNIARDLNFQVVAEGVETPEQVQHLTSGGVRFAQGWLYSRDVTPEALAKLYFSISSEEQTLCG